MEEAEIMIEISKRGRCLWQFQDSMLPDLCLQICGGGYTASQTANAMILKSKVEQDGVGKYKGVTVKKVVP